MRSLDEFEGKLEALIGRPTDMRPFVCEGSPLDCCVFIVGTNPATTMEADFWQFWRSGYGFDKTTWFEEYKKDRASRPLRPGKTRRNPVSNTRRVIDWVSDAASPCACLETNIYSMPAEEKSGITQEGLATAPFEFLLDVIKPLVLVAHGEDAVQEIKQLAPRAHVIFEKHFARGWSAGNARLLGERVRDTCLAAGKC